MIAKRFQSVGRVAMGAVAAMGLYLITSQVAAERTELERVNRQILATKKDIRQLEMELGTRANLRQLERWNGDVLALTTPDADQFLKGEVQLASLDSAGLSQAPRYAPTAMVTAMVAIPDDPKADAERRALIAESAAGEATMPQAAASKKPALKPVAVAEAPKAEPKKPEVKKPVVRQAEVKKPEIKQPEPKKPELAKKTEPAKKTAAPKALARADTKLLGNGLMEELSRKARAEARGSGGGGR